MERTFSYFFVGIDDLEEDANQMKDDLEGESQAYLIFVASISSGASVKKITERNFFDN